MSPLGVATSSSGMADAAKWMSQMREVGVTTVRAFPEWPSIEPRQGEWHWERADALLQAAGNDQLEVTAIVMGSVPWSGEKPHTFPMSDLGAWSGFIEQSVTRYKDRIHFWEVWNEGNGGFNGGHHTAADYGRLAAATFEAAKKVDPSARIGLTTASFDPAYLEHAILAQQTSGTPGRFDYLCVHPYEIADGIGRPNGEIPYLWMTRPLREMLRRTAPDKANSDIWITEIGRNVAHRKDTAAAEQEAATALVKIYVMAFAQGIARVQWFEAQDPAGEEPGFGLLRRDGTRRPSFEALKKLATILGPSPKYLGWLALGETGHAFGFVFQGPATPVLVAWKAAGDPDTPVTFPSNVRVQLLTDSLAKLLESGETLTLSDTPVFISDFPASLTGQAQSSREEPFPWGGNFANAKTVSTELSAPSPTGGVFLAGRHPHSIKSFPDGSSGIEVGANQSIQFFVHPSFASLQTRDYYVRITVRRTVPGNVGMNLHYEVADSHGGASYRNVGTWFSLSKDDGWQTFTWHVKDACFAKMWAYDFSLVPEQSQPFVLGKVEVSTTAF
jgi:hypothetical protein